MLGKREIQTPEAWDGDERRREQNIVLDLLAQQNDKLDKLTDVVRDTVNELRAHAEGETARIAAIAAGFPDSDPIGHRRYHEAEIKRIERRAEFWSKLFLELSKWGLAGFLGWVAVTLWHEFIKGPK